MRQALEAGAHAHGFGTDLWTWQRVSRVVTAVTGVVLTQGWVWRLLTGRLGVESAATRALRP